jgi:dipeptidyl aminopeptidase/acylaminoacyl peptidase
MRQLARLSLLLVALAPIADAQAVRQASASPLFSAEDALDITSFQASDLTADGRWLAATSSVRRDGFGADFRRDGDPTYVRPNAVRLWVIDTRTGERRAVLNEKRNVRAARWSPDGAQLSFLQFNGTSFEPVIWNRASGRMTTIKAPAGKYVAENSDLRWSADGSRLVYSLRTPEWRKQAQTMFANLTAGPVLVMSSKEPFLSWDALRRMSARQSVVAYDLKSGQTTELLPEGRISNFDLTEDGSAIVASEDITKKTDYDVIFGTENQLVARRLDCTAQQTACPKPRTVIPSLKQTTIVWARDGKRFAYSKEGKVFTGTIGDTATTQIAGAPASEKNDPADTTKATRDRRAKMRFSAVRYSPTGDALVISNNEGLWLQDVAGGTKELIVATSDSNPELPRVQLATWSDDGRKLYFTSASRTKWERGILRYDRDAKKLDALLKDGRMYSGIRVSKDGGTVVFNVASGNRPADIYVADANFQNARLLTRTNPQLEAKRLGKTDLLPYLDADGHKKYAVVHYPSDYTPDKAYPTVFIIYEDFFDDSFDATANILNANGYLVVKPSVDFDIGFPGEAWLKGVTSAANKLIEAGIADSTRLGVQGGSYGGYATNLLITQTNRFRAAINISGKVDIISFYTDSPRLGVRNIHAAEKSQDRLGATLWQQPQKYVAHSAIMFADRIKTPLMLITGQLDSNVPADNTREMYYALRRLDKEVVWVNYMNGGHGGGNDTVENWLDMNRRIVEWYDAKLKRPAEKLTTN